MRLKVREYSQFPGRDGVWSQGGFSMIEVIAVLVLLGVIAAVVGNYTGTTGAELAAEEAILKSHLRFAQMRAMNDTVPWGISFSGNTYTLTENGAASTTNLPGTTTNNRTIDSALTLTPSASAITFDTWGSPGTTTITITLSDGSETRAITVTRNTGFIP